ncbi:MAG: DNA mismatch repair endonuclease MutL [Succinivibrio sp.]
MASIRLLSKQLASQIAAGEVVERPASVVKELLENAVDAKGSHILCQIRGAGRLLIRVRDDGEGIVKEDLPLALAPHATSKIRTVEDLSKITTLGFRGEALASIASVSKLTLTSHHKDAEDAYLVRVEGSDQCATVEPCAHPVGTTVDVSELFFNTPARRRFLKSDRTEFMRIRDVFVRTALSHPGLAFELTNDGKSVLKVARSSVEQGVDLKRTAILLGGDFSKEGISVLAEDPNLMMEGMLLPPPSEQESLPEQIYLFLNSRPIADRLVTHAIKEAFYEVLGKTLPVRCVLYLNINPENVDVNVHPRKDEVRFHEPALIHDLITDAIVNALRKAGIRAVTADEGLLAGQKLAGAKDDHRAAFDIASGSLPEFPSGLSSFNSANSVAASLAGHADALKNLSDEKIRHSISIFRSQVASSNVGLNAELADMHDSVSTQDQHERVAPPGSDLFLLDIVGDNAALVKTKGRYYLLSLDAASRKKLALDYELCVRNGSVEQYKLVMPFSITLPGTTASILRNCTLALSRLGFNIRIFRNRVELVAIPSVIRGCNLERVTSRLFACIKECYESNSIAQIEAGQCNDKISELVASNTQRQVMSYEQCKQLLLSLPHDSPLSSFEGGYIELNLNALCQKLTGENNE